MKALYTGESTMQLKKGKVYTVVDYKKGEETEVREVALFGEDGLREWTTEYRITQDNINPKHYTQGGIETIDYLQAKLTPAEFEGFLKGNIIKYVTRERLKGNDEDLKKAKRYLDKLIEFRRK